MLNLTVEQAQQLVDMYEIDMVVLEGEERDMLQEQNPELLAACIELHRYAYGELSSGEGEGNG